VALKNQRRGEKIAGIAQISSKAAVPYKRNVATSGTRQFSGVRVTAAGPTLRNQVPSTVNAGGMVVGGLTKAVESMNNYNA